MNDEANTAVEEAQREFPTYRSHKEVHALKLSWIEPAGGNGYTRFCVADEDYPDVVRPNDSEVVKRCKATPEDAGYYVVYPDGFESWSPSEAFEAGYSPL